MWEMVERLGVFGAVAVLLAWIIRALFKQLLSKDMEAFKGDLKHAHESEIARLKSDLRVAAFQRETTFESLHQMRLRAIATLYKHLVRAQLAMANAVKPLTLGGEPSLDERGDQAVKSFNSLNEYFTENRLYFPESACENIEGFLAGLRNAWFDFTFAPTTQVGDRNLPDIDKWHSAWTKVRDETPPLLKEIEKVFREVIRTGRIDHEASA